MGTSITVQFFRLAYRDGLSTTPVENDYNLTCAAAYHLLRNGGALGWRLRSGRLAIRA
jgi:hypothetical protein